MTLDDYPPRGTLADIAVANRVNVCFVDVGTDLDRAAVLMADAAGLNPSVPVVAVHSGNDPGLILRSLRLGASEFLFQPFEMAQMREALERLARLRREGHSQVPSAGRVYCVMPGKGACGASTLAVNLAFQARRIRAGRVLLADMDALTGMVSFLLKLKSSYSFADALLHAAEMDADLWKGLISNCQGFDVLLSPENPADAAGDGHDATPLIEYTRELYETVILDCPGPFGDWNLSVARSCDELLMVTTNELPALHCTRRSIAYLDQNGVDRMKIRLTVNRFSPGAGLGREAIETALHAEVFHLLPCDDAAVQKALMEGRPVRAGTGLGKAIAAMADRLAGREAKPKKSSLLGGLFSLFESSAS